MSERIDLTRWNRAGLTRFRYVDGNAVEYLEILRQKLVEQFADPKTGSCEWLNPPEKIPAKEVKQENETLVQRQERLSLKQKRILETYHQNRRDWAWEITRTFARSCHILTEYANTYANEGFLDTATQWDHVRRLVEMLDYHPAPPASASTRLVFVAKEDKPGVVAKGFQVKNSPPTGGDKVIFETLEDLFIDPALNEIRPKGWNQSDDPAVRSVPPDNNGSTQPPAEEQPFSFIANGPAINLQGVGETWALQLNTLSDNEEFKIKDFLDLDPEDSGIILDPADPDFVLDPEAPGAEIGAIRLKELKAKATVISNFELEAGWSDITNWLLHRIASESPESLAEITGNPLNKVEALQLRIELIGAYLDQTVYEKAKLKDLQVPAGSSGASGEPDSVPTFWRAKRKPKVVPGQVAMIFREPKDIAEAATIDKIDETSGTIHLLLNQVDYSWTTWPKSEIALHVSPRWKRNCWMNNEGIDIIRTVDPHGFTKDAYISWQEDEKWRYAKVKEADKRTMRLELDGILPQPGAEIVMSHTFDGDKLPADYQEIVLINDDGEDKEPNVEPKKPELVEPDYPENLPKPIFEIKKIFPIDKGGGGAGGGGGGGLLPPASLPKIGSFLFPSPMLPMDLVKVAVDLLLSLGVMQIPSTGEFVIKGMPFGGMLEGASDVPTAATKLVELLDGLNTSAKWLHNEAWDDARLFEVLDMTKFNADNEPTVTLIPIYYDLNCENGLVPDWVTDNVKVVNSLGVGVPKNSLSCLNGRVVDSSDQPVGYQPFSTEADGTLVQFKLTEWDETNWDGTKSPHENKQANMEKLLEDAENDASVLFKLIDKRLFDELGNVVEDEFREAVEISGPLLAVSEVPLVKAVVEASEPLYVFDGKPEELVKSDWVVGRFTDGLRGLKIRSITEHSDDDNPETFSVGFSNLFGNEGELQKVYADFRGSLIAEGASINETNIESEDIELEDVPDSLKVGRTVLLAGCGKQPVAAKIESIDGKVITTNPPAIGCTKGNLIILGNVVLAGHGESKPVKILGSGDAAKSNQEFTLKVEEVSFTPDATKSSGVAAAIEVEVAGRVWEQVSTLKDSAPEDHHYAIRMTEAGYVKILFGDGQNGRRLPSGKNNLRIRYRVGSGLVGNLPAGSLEKPVNPNPLIEAVLQPIGAAGGGNMEDTASLRENAPSTLLALERAVSLSDFSHLAASLSNIWQAKAYRQIFDGGRTERVNVVIVPADGVYSSEIIDATQFFLQKHALPGVTVTIERFKPVLFDLNVTLRVRYDEFISEEVKKAVTSAILDHFTLKNRKLGGNLHLSEVYKVVEGVKGVENSICEIFEHPSESDQSKGTKAMQVIKAADESTIIYLDPDEGSSLTVTVEEYLP